MGAFLAEKVLVRPVLALPIEISKRDPIAESRGLAIREISQNERDYTTLGESSTLDGLLDVCQERRY
jgi:hypothetical protein